ncbi:MAG: small-conductance mechanosensitive channel/CRP-like cAMP-binding protein [Motiliproteus sp.]|jgi:small-conductance mechanosensitive channel/CRP-like cAMP-binding protein
MWNHINMFAWHDGMLSIAVYSLAVGVMLLRYNAPGKKAVLITLGVLLLSFLGMLLSGVLSFFELASSGVWLLELSLFVEGMALIRLSMMLILRIILPRLRLNVPRILEDIIVFIGYLGWIMVQLHDAGLELSSIVTTSTVITAMVAFSMQDTLGNLLAGLALQLDNSVDVGDWIQLDEISGRVVQIRWRHTAVQTRNWETVIVPNSQMMKGKFLVLGRHGDDPVQWRRWIWFNVGYQERPPRVIEVIETAIRRLDIPNVAKDPQPSCVLMGFEESYGRYALRYWLTDLQPDDPTDSIVRTHIFSAMQREGMRLAYPEQHIRMTKETDKRDEMKISRQVADLVNMLRGMTLFNRFPDEELREIAQRLKYAPFARDDIITRQGARANWLYFLIEGQAESYIELEGQPRRRLSTLKPGSYFGEMGLLTGTPRIASVRALEDCRCYRMEKNLFQEVMRNHPELAAELSTHINSRETGLDSQQTSETIDLVVTQAKPVEDRGWVGKLRSFLRV